MQFDGDNVTLMEQYYSNQGGGGSSGFGNLNGYYGDQEGGSIGSTYAGYQFQGQRGRGWFGSVIRKGIVPLLSKLLPYLGGKAVDAYSDMATDFRAGKDLKEIGKRQLKRSGASVLRDLASKVDNQEVSGLKRRKLSKRRGQRKKKKVPIVKFGNKKRRRYHKLVSNHFIGKLSLNKRKTKSKAKKVTKRRRKTVKYPSSTKVLFQK